MFINNKTPGYRLNENYLKFKLWFNTQGEYKERMGLYDFEKDFLRKTEDIEQYYKNVIN